MPQILNFPESDVYVRVAMENACSFAVDIPDSSLVVQFTDLVKRQLHANACVGFSAQANLHRLTVGALLSD